MEADFISLNPTLTVATRGLVGEELISLMKPSAILINTSRGQVLDEGALEAALRQGHIRAQVSMCSKVKCRSRTRVRGQDSTISRMSC